MNHLHESAAVGGHGGRGRGVFLEEVHCKSEGTNHSCCPPEVSVNRGRGKRGRNRAGASVVVRRYGQFGHVSDGSRRGLLFSRYVFAWGTYAAGVARGK